MERPLDHRRVTFVPATPKNAELQFGMSLPFKGVLGKDMPT